MFRIYYHTERFAELRGHSCYGYTKHPESETSQPWNRNKLIDFTNFINLWQDFINNDITEPDIASIIERHRTNFYIQMLNYWKTVKNEITLDELLSRVTSRPSLFYGNFFSKLYQRIAVFAPHVFVRLKH